MSRKRGADVQMGKDGTPFAGDGSESMTPDPMMPQRATASTMAKRKLIRPRGHRANSPSSGAPLALPAGAFQVPGSNSNPASNFTPSNFNFSFTSSAPQNNDSNGTQLPSSSSAFQFGGANAGSASGSAQTSSFTPNIFTFGGTSSQTPANAVDMSSQSQSQPPSMPSFGGFNAFGASNQPGPQQGSSVSFNFGYTSGQFALREPLLRLSTKDLQDMREGKRVIPPDPLGSPSRRSKPRDRKTTRHGNRGSTTPVDTSQGNMNYAGRYPLHWRDKEEWRAAWGDAEKEAQFAASERYCLHQHFRKLARPLTIAQGAVYIRIEDVTPEWAAASPLQEHHNIGGLSDQSQTPSTASQGAVPIPQVSTPLMESNHLMTPNPNEPVLSQQAVALLTNFNHNAFINPLLPGNGYTSVQQDLSGQQAPTPLTNPNSILPPTPPDVIMNTDIPSNFTEQPASSIWSNPFTSNSQTFNSNVNNPPAETALQPQPANSNSTQNSNIFGNIQNSTSTSAPNIFGNLQSSAPTTNISGNMSSQKPQSNLFGQSQPTSQAPQLFGQSKSSVDQDTAMDQSSGAQSSPTKPPFQFGASAATVSNLFGNPQISNLNNSAPSANQNQSPFPNLFGNSANVNSNIFQNAASGQASTGNPNTFGGFQSSISTGVVDKPDESKSEGKAEIAPFGSLSGQATAAQSQPKLFQWNQQAAIVTPEISSDKSPAPEGLNFSAQTSSTPSAPLAAEQAVDTTQPEASASSNTAKSLFDRISTPASSTTSEPSASSSNIFASAAQSQQEDTKTSNMGKSLFERVSAPETQADSAPTITSSTFPTTQTRSPETSQPPSNIFQPNTSSFSTSSQPSKATPTTFNLFLSDNPALKPTFSLKKQSSAPKSSEAATPSSSLTGLFAANGPTQPSPASKSPTVTMEPSEPNQQAQAPKINGVSDHATSQNISASSVSSSVPPASLPSSYTRHWDEIRSGELPMQKVVDILLHDWILTVEPPVEALEMVKETDRPILRWKWRHRLILREWKQFVDDHGDKDRNLLETFRTVQALRSALDIHSNMKFPESQTYIEEKYIDEVHIKKMLKESQMRWAQQIENIRKRRLDDEDNSRVDGQKKQRVVESSLAQVVSDSDGTKKRRFDEQEQADTAPKRSRSDVNYPSLPENSSKTSQMFASVASGAKSSDPVAEKPKVPAQAFSVPQSGSSITENTNPAASSFKVPQFGLPATDTSKSTTPTFQVPQFGLLAKVTTNSTTPNFQVPQFGSSPGVNFMAQFGKAAQATAEEEKRKKMDDDYDSEEETKEQWSERYDREQAVKKAEIEKASKAQTSQPQFKPSSSGEDGAKNTVTPTDNAIFAKASNASTSSGQTSRVSTSPIGDNTWKPDSPIKFGATTEQPKLSVTAPTPTKPSEVSEGSLFVDENPEKPAARNLFSFGSSTSTTPKVAPPSLFKLGASSTDTPTKPGSSVFMQGALGNASTSGTSSPSLFSPGASNCTPRPKFDFTKSEPTSTPSPPPSDGWKDFLKTSQSGQNPFAIPKPSSGSPAPSIFASLTPSRGASPALTSATASGAETDNNDDTEEAQEEEQLDFSKANAGEEDEDLIFSVKARIQEMASDTEGAAKSWKPRGIGELRVLKNRDNSKTRVLVRQETSAKVLLNAGLLAGVSYGLAGPKYVNFTVAASDGGLNRWLIQVGKENKAKELSELLEANKKG